MGIPNTTINQWLIHMMPGLSEPVKEKLKAIPGNVTKRGPVVDVPEHLREKLPAEYDNKIPNAFIAFDLKLPVQIPGDGVEEFLTPTFGELAENALREFIENEKVLRSEGHPPGSKEFVVNVNAWLKEPPEVPVPMYAIQLLDNGRGMPKDLVSYILKHIESQRGKPYQLPLNYRVEETGNLIGGYGIVMAVNYVLRLKGAFSVRAIEGRGTKIRMDLPVEAFGNIRQYIPA